MPLRARIVAGRWSLLVAGAAGAGLLAHAWTYLPFFADDGFISLRYAERLLQGHGLTWTDGPPVEGYSNLLWVLGCAALGALGIDLVTAARALGMGCALLTIGAVVEAFRGPTPAHRAAQVVGALVIGLSGPFAVWAVGGLEPTMVAAALAVGLAAVRAAHDDGLTPARGITLGVAQVALTLARADGLLLALAVALGVLAAGRGEPRSRRIAATAVAPALVAYLGQLAFRLSFYDDWLPNTAYAKVVFHAHRLQTGLHYVVTFSSTHVALLVALGLAIFALRGVPEHRQRADLAAVPLVVWIAYVVAMGGDTFPAWRPILPAVAAAAFVIGDGVLAASAGGQHALRNAAATAVVLLGLGWSQERLGEEELIRARHERWEWDGYTLGLTLRRSLGDRAPLIAIDAAGALPFYAGLPALDMLGLNDRWLAHHRPAGMGLGKIGHELGNADYVWDAAPDLLIFGGPAGQREPQFRFEQELLDRPDWADTYGLVELRPAPAPDWPGVPSLVWVRRASAKLGFERTDRSVSVPGLALAEGTGVVAHPDADGQLVAELAPGVTLPVHPLPLDAGRWRASVAGTGCTVTPEVIDVAAGVPVPLTLQAGADAPCVVAALRLDREDAVAAAPAPPE